MTEISELPPEVRAARYRALAADAKRQARMSVSERMRDSYTLMADQWDKLAAESEFLAKKLRALEGGGEKT